MVNEKSLHIEVAYANLKQQAIISLDVLNGTTVREAIVQSNILNQFPEIDLTKQKVGIFGKVVKLEDVIKEGDRVEIYVALLIDPKQIRKLRAVKQKILK